MGGSETRDITVNQVGYPVNGRKLAILTGTGGGYRVVDAANGAVVFKGETKDAGWDPVSGAHVHIADFSELTGQGEYRIERTVGSAPNTGDEAPTGVAAGSSGIFAISDKPYKELQRGLLKAFYYYRCGVELTEAFAGPWAHPPCHTSAGIVHGHPERRRFASGGWHDAGDYGKYSGAGAKAVADLLFAYELYPAAFAEPLPLPESDGATPDVLLECKVELDWLLLMQDEDNGGVFHKLTTLQFPPLDTMPEDDLNELYFSPVSATATADFAGVMALAARLYRPFDEEYAALCLAAAEKAWSWLQQHPEVPGFRNPEGISTGEYGDKADSDERYWAAAELYRTTGNAVYHDAFRKLAGLEFSKTELGWTDMGGYGTAAYLLGGEEGANKELYASLKETWLAEAQRLLQQSERDRYRISLREEDYIWGSNMVLMNNAMALLLAERLSGDPQYADCALEHVHYMMGRNVLDISYVTGYGDRPVMYPHHRPSVGDGVADPVPGLVSGGPNRGLQDEYVAELLKGQPAARCFADHELSYATNEVTIYWNSPAVFVAARFNA